MFRLLIYAFLCVMIVACGGGTTASKSKYAVKINVDIEQIQKQRNKSMSRLLVGNTLIGSVVIGYGLEAPDETIEVMDKIENNEEILIEGLEAGKTYNFSVSAYDYADTMVCFGGATAQIMPNATEDVVLECTFGEKYAVENMAFEIFSKAAEGTLSTTEAEDAVAYNFTMHNGMDRSEFVYRLRGSMTAEFGYSNDTLSGISLIRRDRSASGKTARTQTTEEVEENAGYLVKFIYTDGSYDFNDIRFVREAEGWKIAGNGLKYGLKARPQMAEFYPQSAGEQPQKIAGLSLHYNQNQYFSDIETVTVSVPQVQETGQTSPVVLSETFENSDGLLYSNSTYLSPTSEWVSLVNSNIIPFTGSLAQDTAVSFAVREYADPPHTETESFRVLGGYTFGEIESAEFPVVTPVREGSTVRFNLQLPSWVRRLEFYFEGIVSYEHVIRKSRISIYSPSFLFDDFFNDIEEGSDTSIFIFTAYDSKDRAYSIYMPYDYILDTIGTEPGGGAGILGNGFSALYTQDYSGQTYYPDIKGAGAASGFSSVAFVSSSDLSSAGSNAYNPIIMNTTFSEGTPSVISRLIVYAYYQNGLFNAKTLVDSDGDIFMFAGLYGTGRATVMRISPDLQTIRWVKNYVNAFDAYHISGSFTDMALVNEGSEIVLLLTGIDAGFERADLIRISAANGLVQNAVRLSSSDGDNIRPLKIGVYKPKNRIVVLTERKAAPSAATADYCLSVFSDSLAHIDSRTVLENVTADSFDMAVSSSGSVWMSYALEISGVKHMQVAKVDGDLTEDTMQYGLTVSNKRTVMPVDSQMQYTSYGTKLAVTDNYVYLLGRGYEMPQTGDAAILLVKMSLTQNLVWVKSLPVLVTPNEIMPAPLDSVLIYGANKVFNVSADGSMEFFEPEDITPVLYLNASGGVTFAISDYEVNAFTPTEEGSSSETSIQATGAQNISLMYLNSSTGTN